MPQVFKIGVYVVFLWFAEGVPLDNKLCSYFWKVKYV